MTQVGGFFTWETEFFTHLKLLLYRYGLLRLFRVLFYLIFYAPLTAREFTGEQVVA